MGELAYMEAEWDLEAIVRGRSRTGTVFSGESSGGFSQFHFHQETNLFFESETADLDELGELYKPFYPFPTQTISDNEPKSFRDDQTKEQKLDHLQWTRSGMDRNAESKMKKSKKNQQKRVVKEVKEESLSSDVWAWRKYGQKPIKGSPYPRSYYRCSSSKGCLARKQVERSPTNPEIFIVTYTNEHKHALPTRRNSLAGSTRIKPNHTKSSLTESKSGNQKVTSPTSNQPITPADEFSVPIQENGSAQLNSEQTTGEFEGIVDALSPDLMSGVEFFPDFAGSFDELLKNEEFDFNSCFLDYWSLGL